MLVDETKYDHTKVRVEKEPSEEYGSDQEDPDNHEFNIDPFLFQNSHVVSGRAKALVLCVGKNTRFSKGMKTDFDRSDAHT